MAYRLRADKDADDNFRAIAIAEIDGAIADLDDPDLSSDKKVHQSRRHCKAVRALARLYRPAMRKDKNFKAINRHFRDLARTLSAGRDAKAMLEAYDDLMKANKGAVERRDFAPIRRVLTRRKAAFHASHQAPEAAMKQARAAFDQGRGLVEAVAFCKGRRTDNVKAVEKGLKAVYKRARKEMAAAKADPAGSHEWRKWAKTHWYHCRLLQGLWPHQMAGRTELANKLGDALGKEHDLTVLNALLRADPGAFGDDKRLKRFRVLLVRRQAALRSEAQRLGAALFAEKAGAFSKRMESAAAASGGAQDRRKSRATVPA